MGEPSMNVFIKDNNWQRTYRDNILKPYYKKISKDGRFLFLDKGKLAEHLQREKAIDTIIQLNNGGVLGIEEKIVRWPGYKYTSYTFETMSCTVTGREKLGWMHYSICDYLMYGFVQEDNTRIVAHFIPFPKLQEWFFEDERYLNYRPFVTKQINHTETRIVPISDVWNAIPECKEILINEESN